MLRLEHVDWLILHMYLAETYLHKSLFYKLISYYEKKMAQMRFATSVVSDQSAHPRNLIRDYIGSQFVN